ncbi:alpha/beta hydrolase [Mycobacterium avium]|uniref:alpha/beta hydrolase n=1 Tax=Mycobacterium avium complex (MAC) TaxID=120793 RepID=UPI0039EC74D3
MSALVAEAEDPKAVLVAIHGGGTTAVYFDCPGHPSFSLLRAGATAGFTVVALDRPGYGSSAPYPEAMTRPGQRVELAYGAVDRILGQRPRGAGLFLMGHSGGCELVLRMAADERGRTCSASSWPAPVGTTTPPPGRSSRPRRASVVPPDCANCCGTRKTFIRLRFSAVRRSPRAPRPTRTRWCRTGPAGIFRRSPRPCVSRCTSASPNTKRSGRTTLRRWTRSRRCSPVRRSSPCTGNPAPGTTSASGTRRPTITRRCCPSRTPARRPARRRT